MKIELFRYFKNPLYWTILGGGLSVRAVFACLDCFHRNKQFWALSADFWNKIGSVTEGFLILLVLIHLFSEDHEKRTSPVVNSTVYGRGWLFCNRLSAGGAAAVTGIVLLTAGNAGISMWFGRGLSCPLDFSCSFFAAAVAAASGGFGFFLLSACVCDIAQNQPAAMCICGFPFALSYFVNVDAIHPFHLAWFFRYGFFTELTRGRIISDLPFFWLAWYPVLLTGVLLLTIKKRKERKEL